MENGPSKRREKSGKQTNRLARRLVFMTNGASCLAEDRASTMRCFVTPLVVFLVAVTSSGPAAAQQPPPEPPTQQTAPDEAPSPWLLAPMFSSTPKLGTAVGGLGAYLHVFDPGSRVSLFGIMYQYSSTHSQIASAFARTPFGADHHRIVFLTAFGKIKNDYEDYLGTGQTAEDRR
jgi:hypothetical protein